MGRKESKVNVNDDYIAVTANDSDGIVIKSNADVPFFMCCCKNRRFFKNY